MIFGDLVTQIKTEGRLADDDAFTQTVLGIINESFKEAVESQRPFELRNQVSIALTSGVGTVPVPTDFFIHHQLFYTSSLGPEYQLTDQDKAISPAPRGLFGYPKTFEVENGLNFILGPANLITSADTLRVIYYQKPPEVSEAMLNQVNPIPRLEPFLIRCALRRVRMYHSDDLQVAQMLTADITSAASAYTKDTPERESKTGS